MKKSTVKKMLGVALICVFIAAFIFLAVKFTPWILSLQQEEARLAFKNEVGAMGFWGWLMTVGIQVLQIIVAVLPGEPVEIIAGYLYGTWGGLFTCLFGILIGTMLVFLLVRLFREKFITLFISKEKLESFKFLKDTPRLENVTFILFLIPGTPKDALTYAAALTKINPLRFFAIATLARIPSVISSTWAGSAIMKGNWLLTAVIFAATAGVGILGIWLNGKYRKKLEGKSLKALDKDREL